MSLSNHRARAAHTALTLASVTFREFGAGGWRRESSDAPVRQCEGSIGKTFFWNGLLV